MHGQSLSDRAAVASVADTIAIQNGMLEDSGGNQYKLKTMSDGKLWLTDNLNLDIPGAYCYDDDKQNCKRYGRLYTWEAARQACGMLGRDWRLPSNEEWQQMARHYGGIREDSNDDGNAAYQALLLGGKSGFNALLGEGRGPNGSYERVDRHGFYWTATENDQHTAWFYNFGRGSAMLNRHEDGEKSEAFCVRCVRDVSPE